MKKRPLIAELLRWSCCVALSINASALADEYKGGRYTGQIGKESSIDLIVGDNGKDEKGQQMLLGAFFYTKYHVEIPLCGYVVGDRIILSGSLGEDVAELFEGRIVNRNVFKGTWTSTTLGKSLPFTLHPVALLGKPGKRPALRPEQVGAEVTEGCTVTPFPGEAITYKVDLRGGALCHHKIHEDLPIYHFHAVAKDLDGPVSIDVSRGSNKAVIQTLNISPPDIPPHTKDVVEAIDMNFDGYNDIRILDNAGAIRNEVYNAWLFDPEKGIFIFSPELSGLTSMMVDPKSKTIQAGWHLGYNQNSWYTLRFDSRGHLFSFKTDESDYDFKTKTATHKVTELRDGKWVEVLNEKTQE